MPLEFRQITSRANPEIKKIRSLALRKYREEERLFITEGLRHALEAAEAGWEFQALVIEESSKEKDLVKRLLALCAKQDCLCLEVSKDIMGSITKRDNAQTVMGVLKQRWSGLNAVANSGEALWIALEEIRDPGNLGTIMRTADAVGAAGIILIENTCDPYSLEAIRASMGSFPHIQLVRCGREEFAEWAGKSGFQVVGTHLKTSHDYRKIGYKAPLILLMGNEQAGLTDRLAASCTHLVKIPMKGKADSLNVSVATAIMLYEINRAGLVISDAG
jgi:RNA methyltransferase, TrmH family